MTTWGPKAASMTEEERARYLRGVEWECEQGHCAEVKCVDGLTWRRFNTRTMRWELHLRGLRWIPALIGDQFRAVAADLRRFRTRHIQRRKNPYWG